MNNQAHGSHTFGGPWTEEKLRMLAEYLPAFNNVLKGKMRTIYIDAFAGNGYCDVLDPVILRNGTVPLYGLYFALSNPSKKARAVAMRIAKHITGKRR